MSDNLLILDQRLRNWVQAEGSDFRSMTFLFDAAVGMWYITAQDLGATPKTLVYEAYHDSLAEGFGKLLDAIER